MQFITDITLIIDEANYDPGRLKRILRSYSPEHKGSCYQVKGTFEELEKLVHALSRCRHHSSPTTHGQTYQPDQHTATCVQSVSVSRDVMAYIEQRCADKLKKVQGTSFVIETKPDLRTEHGRTSSTVQVTFRPRHNSLYTAHKLHSDLLRQRFITFYQRTASDLQVTSVRLGPHDQNTLQQKFPRLLFKPSSNKHEVMVMGPFAHVAKLKEILPQNTVSLSRSPVNRVPARTPSSRTSASPAHSKAAEEETCPICMDKIVTSKKETLRCKHSFCRDCLKRAFDYKPVCPNCGEVYGVLTGTQPEGGTMTVSLNSLPLPGFEKYGKIIIHYYIPNGTQKEEHPNPGQPYEGVSRIAYLPDSPEGRAILNLLRRAFDQRLIFTIGRSTTSGRNNVVTWNDIHHKTSTHGGPTHYGYPDPDYLSRVRDELKVKGIE